MKKALCVFLCVFVVFCLSTCSRTERSYSNSETTTSQEPKDLPALHSEYSLILDNIVTAYPWNDDDLIIVPENP